MKRLLLLIGCLLSFLPAEVASGQLFQRLRERREQQTPEQRQERRERISDGVRGLIEQFNQPQNVRIDFPRINGIVDAVLQVLVRQVPQLEQAGLAFAVDQSSFEGNTFVVEGSIAGWAPWDQRDPPQLSSAAFNLNAELLQPTPNNILIELDMQTDVVGLINFGLERLVRTPASDLVKPSALGREYDEIKLRTMEGIQQAIATFGPLHSLDDVVRLVPVLGPLNLHGVNERLSFLRGLLQLELPPGQAEAATEELRRTTSEIDRSIAMSTIPHRDASGHIRSISITLPEGQVIEGGMANVTGLAADVTPSMIHVGATLGATQSGILAYRGSKLVVGPWLARKQREIDPDDPDQIRELAEQIEGRLEPILPSAPEDLPPPQPPE